MKKLHLAFLSIILMGMLLSCSKSSIEDEPLPQPKTWPNYTLSFTAAGIDITELRYTTIQDLISGSTDVGDRVRFETHNFVLVVFFVKGNIEPHAIGTIDGNGFFFNTDSNYINICNGAQNVPVRWKIKQ